MWSPSRRWNLKRKISLRAALCTALFLFALLVYLPGLRASTYYVATQGGDSNNGLSPDTAWRTITHAAQTAKAGDTVNIVRGVYEDETIVFANSGTAEEPIVFQAYLGSPRIRGKGAGYGISFAGQSHITVSGLSLERFYQGIVISGIYPGISS